MFFPQKNICDLPKQTVASSGILQLNFLACNPFRGVRWGFLLPLPPDIHLPSVEGFLPSFSWEVAKSIAPALKSAGETKTFQIYLKYVIALLREDILLIEVRGNDVGQDQDRPLLCFTCTQKVDSEDFFSEFVSSRSEYLPRAAEEE